MVVQGHLAPHPLLRAGREGGRNLLQAWANIAVQAAVWPTISCQGRAGAYSVGLKGDRVHCLLRSTDRIDMTVPLSTGQHGSVHTGGRQRSRDNICLHKIPTISGRIPSVSN